MSVPHLLHHLALGQDVWRAKSFSALDANFVQVEDLAESLRTSIDKDATYRDAIIARILEQEAPAFGFNSTDIQQLLIDWSNSDNLLQSGSVVPVTGDSIKIREWLRAHAINQYANVMGRSRLRLNNTESPSAFATHQAQRVIKKRPLQLQNGSRSPDNKENIPPRVFRKKPVVQTSSKARSTSFVKKRQQARDDFELWTEKCRADAPTLVSRASQYFESPTSSPPEFTSGSERDIAMVDVDMTVEDILTTSTHLLSLPRAGHVFPRSSSNSNAIKSSENSSSDNLPALDSSVTPHLPPTFDSPSVDENNGPVHLFSS
ncbi:hypothetical protein C8R41DRAFT_918217 [Lentinula lateritia]|uniref:Uncharacterized protein n=1 Tax=Lentinula lateritia TaxID=40482 RepID=A0ABQ8VJR8_9AGAR|nr:hypothetical protein C8R41DRAFT_918217 [Lentinula lateritia]